MLRQLLKLKQSSFVSSAHILSLCSVTELNICATQPLRQRVKPDCLADTFLGFRTSLCPIENHGGGKHALFSFKFNFPWEYELHLQCHNVGGEGVISLQAAVPYLDKCYIRLECWQGRETWKWWAAKARQQRKYFLPLASFLPLILGAALRFAMSVFYALCNLFHPLCPEPYSKILYGSYIYISQCYRDHTMS